MIQRIILIAAAFAMLTHVSAAQDDAPLIGEISFEQLLDLPDWFGEELASYRPNMEYVNQIPQHMDDVSIVCVVGTWCSDSRREVPRMFRLMQITNISPETMRMIGVDRDMMSPGGENITLKVERVPTFIFYRDGEEIGRIIETPYASLEKDMLGIILTDERDNPSDETEVGKPDAVHSSGSDSNSQEKSGDGKRHESPESQDRK